jgi:hypothetical protein
MTQQLETEYVDLKLPFVNIPMADATQFLREIHPWTANGDLDIRVTFRFPEADGLVTRPVFVGGPSVQVKLEVRRDQYEAADRLREQLALQVQRS